MADVATKRVAQRGPTIREQLKGMDDADVVTSFLDGEERAFQELVERYQLPPQTVLIEHNGLALHRREWRGRELHEGDRIEVLRVVAGG